MRACLPWIVGVLLAVGCTGSEPTHATMPSALATIAPSWAQFMSADGGRSDQGLGPPPTSADLAVMRRKIGTPSTKADRQALLSVKRLKCAFADYASAEWSGERPNVETRQHAPEYAFEILDIDSVRRAAHVIGDTGRRDLEVVVGTETFSFIEHIGDGTHGVTVVLRHSAAAGVHVA
jgi:hypothetical protein